MVLPISELKQSTSAVKPSKISKRKRKKKSATKKFKKDAVFKKAKLTGNMSSWAQNCAAAGACQWKHEIAYWKAKAISLEYENKILHDIVRQNCIGSASSSRSSAASRSRNNTATSTDSIQSEMESSEEESEHDDIEQEGEWEVSEEFIQFLKENAKYKEDARRERERLKTKLAEKNEIEDLEAGPSQPVSNKSDELKEIYGSNWQRIAALEMSLQSQFMHESDKSKPMYWPNIPFNFT